MSISTAEAELVARAKSGDPRGPSLTDDSRNPPARGEHQGASGSAVADPVIAGPLAPSALGGLALIILGGAAVQAARHLRARRRTTR